MSETPSRDACPVPGRAGGDAFGPEGHFSDEDGVLWLLEDADVPPWFSDEELLEIAGPVTASDLMLLDSIDPAGLGRAGLLAYLQRAEALAGMAAAMCARATVELAGTDGSDSRRDRGVAMELGAARRVGEQAAAASVATARALHVEFPEFLAALSTGEVSEWHCRILVSETAHVVDRDVIAALQARLLPKAKRRTPSQFRRDVRAAVVDLDAEKAAERFERARSDRYVSCKPLPDGMGYLGVVSDWPTIKAMHDVITTDGRAAQVAKGGAKAVRDGDLDASADACRAEAFVARVLGRVDQDGQVCWDREPATVSLTLVMDLPTLQGEDDRHALLDGEPVPAAVGRELAEAATLWRRAVTDPVDGHLLDYGREQYLPAKLRDYVLQRDHCRAPGCTTRAPSRLEMDHAIPFPDGETSAENTGGLCRTHHQMKTERLADVIDSRADGSATWLTGWGQRITIPPRPFLHDPTDRSTASPPPTEPPPPPTPRRPTASPREWDASEFDQPDDPPF